MDHIAPVLKNLLAASHLQQGLSNYSLFARWEEVVGPHLAGNTRPVRVQGEILWVYVNDATLRHHMTYLVPQLLDRIQQSAPGAKINSIRFTLNPGTDA